jgi:uncharacterized protein with beta-barrel porin domain
MAVLMTCLSLFCSDAGALYTIFNTGGSGVYGLSGSDVRPATGSEFGTVSAIASTYNAYALYGNGGNVEISGDFGSGGLIFARAGTYHAYGLYSDTGSITTDALNGTIVATTGEYRAVGLFTENGSITTGDIGGTITAEAGGSSAFGLRNDYDTSITTGNITGAITAVAGGDRAYGFRSYGTIYTLGIDGTITATANGDNAYGLYSSNTLTVAGDIGSNALISATATTGSGAYGLYSYSGTIYTGDINGVITAFAKTNYAAGLYNGSIDSIYTGAINGRITADANTGHDAFGLYSYGKIDVDGIGGNALISATAGGGAAYGLFSSNSSIDIDGDMNGVITAETTNGSYAYGLRSYSDMTIDGNIGSSANIAATAATGSDAYGLYSYNGSIYTGDINGTITAFAKTDNAYGLYSRNGSITTGAINGNITADANTGSNAYGLYANGNLTINGNIGSNAHITANADGDAYGLRGNNGVTTQAINGTITATATTGANAYGLSSGGTMGINYIYGAISAEATAGSGAYGLNSISDMTVDYIGSSADISATAGTSSAYGLLSGGAMDIDYIGGTIHATAGTDNAYGLNSGGVMDIGSIDRTITADATAGSGAYGLRSSSNMTVDYIGSDATITATAGDSNAYGLNSGGAMDIININGAISAEATTGSGAYGLKSSSSMTVDYIDSYANISATAGTDNAYGLNSGGTMDIGSIDGTITATATSGYNAYGLYSVGDMHIAGDIGNDANITATAGDYRAAGLYSANGSVTTGAINGTITATVMGMKDLSAFGLRSYGVLTTGAINGTITAEETTGSCAYALYSGSNMNIAGDIGSTARITATAGDSNAYGLYSANGSITTRAINGTISAEATNGSYAYALYASSDIHVGDIGSNALIYAKTGADFAAGLYSSGGLLTTGAINGTITAEAASGYANAYALYSGSDMLIDSIGSNANITGKAEDTWAFGLHSNRSLTTGDIDGTITAEATYGTNAHALYSLFDMHIGDIGSNANITAKSTTYVYGLHSVNGSIQTGDINGRISAEATNGSYAYALYSNSDMTVGDIGSNALISATAWQNYALGLYSDGSLTTGAIRGTIDANAGVNMAYGILSYGPMDITIDGGTVSAVAHGGTNFAAIQSGGFGSGVLTHDANDTVEIVAGSTIHGDIDLAMNGTDNDVLTLSGDTANSTTFEKDDTDIYNVEHINIIGGTWYINGNVYNSNIALNGGILSGSGTLGDNLDIGGGTLNPGNSIGTINIAGDLTIGSGGVYEVDVNNSEKADNVKVTGTAYLDGTIRGNVFGGELIDHPFDVNVLDAVTLVKVDGGFSATGSTAFPIFSVSYTNDPCVILHVDVDYAYYATTDNQRSVGEAFNDILENDLNSGDMNDVLLAIQNLPDGAAVNNAYNQIMPQDALGQSEIIRNAMNQYSESIFGRMDNIRNGRQYAMSADSRYLLASVDNSVALPPKTNDWMPFAKGFGVWGDRNAESDISGYQYNIYGLAGGIDKLVSENTLIGISVAGSWANINYSQSGTSSDIDSMFCSLYGSYFVDDWHVGVTLGYGHSWYDSQRGIHFGSIDREAKSDHQGNSYSAAVELGKNFGYKTMILEPVAGIGYTAVQESGYTEKGADALNLKVDSDTTDGIYSKLGVRAAKEFRPEKYPDMILVPHASVFWIHDFADRVELSSSFVGGGSFTTEGLEPMSDTFNIGAGLNVYYKKNVRLFVDYGWQSASNFNSNTVQLGAQWSF